MIKVKLPKAVNIAIFFILTVFITPQAFSQEFENDTISKAKKKLSDNIFFGGTFGLQIGTVTSIQAEPLIGYRIHPKINAGIGASLFFFRDSRYDFNSYYYGPVVFTNVFVYKNIYLHTDIENLNVEQYDNLGYATGNRVWVQGLKAGVGYQRMVGDRLGINLSVLWNFTQTIDTPYSNPIIKFGFVF